MNASSRKRLVLPLVSLMAVSAVAAQAQEQRGGAAPGQPPAGRGAPARLQAHPPGTPGRAADARFAHGAIAGRNLAGHPYRGRVAWEGGRWRHEIHNGRDGWWWDVGGVWYFYPQPIEGPPTYVSEDFADDVVYVQSYAPPPPDPAASAVGGAVVGGLLGGLLTGRASGAAAGAVIGGATDAIAGATAASRPGYYLADGNCYYRYPSGNYVLADPRWCY